MIRNLFPLLLVLALAAQLPAADPPATDKPIDLPVTRAVLFSSGVGYFENSGVIDGNATVRLMFKTNQINDVLKSMVPMDPTGQVASVTYGSNDPIDRALHSFGVDISGNPPLPALLNQLRGAMITVAAPEKITGSILNVEAHEKVVGQPPAKVTEFTLNLVTDAGIRAISLDSISTLTLNDPKLREELNQALALLVSARDTDRKPVDIRFTGQGKHEVRIGYLVETPIWKTSYRLDLSDKPLLQGWGIVENTSESDWVGVRLSLISGRPISFTQDLYTPLYISRPRVVPDYFASLMPHMYEEGQLRDSEDNKLANRRVRTVEQLKLRATGMAKSLADGAPINSPAMAAEPTGLSGGLAAVSLGLGVQSLAQASNVGELFSFTLAAPVDMPRRRSAMLPIINDHVTAEKVSIYNQQVMAKYPLNGVYLTNSTKTKMMAGPVTVYDQGAYAGDAQIDHLEPGAKRLLSYAVDLDVAVDPSMTTSSHVTTASIIEGVLHVIRMNTFTQTYRIKNKAAGDKTFIVEHPFYTVDRKLVEPVKYEEKTANVYRFRIQVKAGDTSDFVVREEQPTDEVFAILEQPIDAFAWYSTSGNIPKSVREALAKAIDLKSALTNAQRDLEVLQTELNNIKNDQNRLRENIRSIDRTSQLGKRYLDKLNEQENRLEELEGKTGQTGLIDQARQKVEKARADLENYLKNLNVKA